MKKMFINLTNGIEYLKGNDIPSDVSFIRIQSTHCEQKHWDSVFEDLDNNFLMNLALGNECTVIDYGSRSDSGMSKAMSHGIPLIEYVLNRLWFDKDTIPFVKVMNVHDYFNSVFDDLMLIRPLKAKLTYFKKFLKTDKLNIIVQSQKTTMDGKYDDYAIILDAWHLMNDLKLCQESLMAEHAQLDIGYVLTEIVKAYDEKYKSCRTCKFESDAGEGVCNDCNVQNYTMWERK